MLETLDPDMLLDIRSVHLRYVNKLSRRRPHPRVAETDDPACFPVPHFGEGDPEVDPADLPVLPVHSPDEHHRQFEQGGPYRERDRFHQPEGRPVNLFLHPSLRRSIRSRMRRGRASHPDRNSTLTRSAATGDGTLDGNRAISFSVVTKGRPAAAARILSRSAGRYGWWSRNPKNRCTRKPDARRACSNWSFCAIPENATMSRSPAGSGVSEPLRSTSARGTRRVQATGLSAGKGMVPITVLP